MLVLLEGQVLLRLLVQSVVVQNFSSFLLQSFSDRLLSNRNALINLILIKAIIFRIAHGEHLILSLGNETVCVLGAGLEATHLNSNFKIINELISLSLLLLAWFLALDAHVFLCLLVYD